MLLYKHNDVFPLAHQFRSALSQFVVTTQNRMKKYQINKPMLLQLTKTQ